MDLEFPIEKINFKITCEGTGQVQFFVNGNLLDSTELDGRYLKEENIFKIKFFKKDATDQNSFAKIIDFLINGQSYADSIKSIIYYPDKRYHTAVPLSNNLYFGYIGEMSFKITQKNDLLTRSAWTLANNEFDYVKWPFKGQVYREKTFENIVRDTKFMFTGSLAPEDSDIKTLVDSLRVSDLRQPLRDIDIINLKKWINNGDRVKLNNFQKLPFFSCVNGNNEAISSFLNRAKKLYVASKKYFFVGELLEGEDKNIKDPYVDEIENNSDVLLELPSPWYAVEETKKIIREAKDKNCRIALDLIWLPLITHEIDIDLDQVTEIYFSMNKTWPIYDIRPAFRWSKDRINDLQTLQYEHCTYHKLQPNIFFEIMKRFSFDYVYDKNKDAVEHLCKKFSLDKTNVLIFTSGKEDRHDHEGHTSKHNHLDEFVCLKKLIDYRGKYFW